MKKVTAADNIMDWAHLVIDGIAYCVSRSKPEIHFEGKEHSDLHMLLGNEKHRWNLASRASVVLRESGKWSDERPDKWNVHYANKTLSFDHLGRILSGGPKEAPKAYPKELAKSASMTPESQQWISDKIKKLVEEGKSQEQAAAIAYSMARDKGYDVPEKKAGEETMETKAFDVNQISMETFNKPMQELTDNELRQMIKKLQEKAVPVTPVEPALNPSMTQPEPPAPGASHSSFGIQWMRTAADSPFPPKDEKDEPEEKDDEKDEKDEKGDGEEKKDKKPSFPPKKDKEPKEPKEPKKDSPKEDKADPKKALDILEKFLEKEPAGPESDKIRQLLEMVENLLEGDEDEPGMAPGVPMKVDLQVEKPPMPGMGPGAPKMPSLSPVSPMHAWMQDTMAGFRIHDRVWLKAMIGTLDTVGSEPGRVIAISNDKLVVDWGNDIPTEESPADLVVAVASDAEEGLFDLLGSENAVVSDEATPETEPDVKAEIEEILSKTSIQDLLQNDSPRASNGNAIVHLGTGLRGELMSKLPDGRICVRVAGVDLLLWPYEVRTENEAQGE